MATQGTRRRRPPPCPRPSQGYPYASAGDPLPARASVGIPVHFCRHPHPDRALRRDTRTLLPAPPPRTRLRRSSSAPFRGAWAVPGRISGKQPYPGCSRWAAVPGSSPGYPHVLDRGISPRGEGPTGRGNSFPLPCLSRSNHLTSRRSQLRRLFCEDTRTYFRYPRPGTRALPGGSPWETVLDAGSDLLR